MRPEWQDQIQGRVRTLRIIVAALAAGCLTFAAIAAVQGGAPQANPQGEPIVTFVALAFAAMALVARTVVPAVMVRTGSESLARTLGSQSDPSSDRTTAAARGLMNLLQTKTIIAGAMLEGATFFLLISYLVEGQMISLVAAALLVGLLLTLIPTERGMIRWVEDRLRRLDEPRR